MKSSTELVMRVSMVKFAFEKFAVFLTLDGAVIVLNKIDIFFRVFKS